MLERRELVLKEPAPDVRFGDENTMRHARFGERKASSDTEGSRRVVLRDNAGGDSGEGGEHRDPIRPN